MKKLFCIFSLTLLFFCYRANAQIYPIFSQPKYLFYEYRELLKYSAYDTQKLEENIDVESKDDIFQLGFIYFYNPELKDDKKSLKYLKKALELKNPDAAALLGIFYINQESYSNAISFLRKGEKLGSGIAMLKMGEIFENGNGIFQDEKRAIELYQKALDRNVIGAYAKMGDLYMSGKLVEKDFEQAASYYGKIFPIIEEPENKLAITLKLGGIYDNIIKQKEQLIIEKNPDEKNTALDSLKEERFRYFLNAAEQNNLDSMIMVANYYLQGNGVDKDSNKAIEWFLKAADNKSIPAMEQLGYIYSNGLYGFNRDFKRAFYWYEKAAFAGSKSACWNLGYFYYYGYGVNRDLVKAKRWFDKSKGL
jgi:TPR repeat protein